MTQSKKINETSTSKKHQNREKRRNKNKKFKEICNEYFESIGYYDFKDLGLKKQVNLYTELNIIEKIIKTGYLGEIPPLIRDKTKLLLDINESKISSKLIGEKPTDSLIWNNEQKKFVIVKNDDKKINEITTLLKKHKYEITYTSPSNLICYNAELDKTIFLHLTYGSVKNTEIPLSILSKFLNNFNSIQTTKRTDTGNLEIEYDDGALTDFGWHAFETTSVRLNALKRRILIDGIKPTLGTLEHLERTWPNMYTHQKYVPIVKNDIEWIERNFPTYLPLTREKLNHEFREMCRYHPEANNKVPDLKFIVNCKN
tara:strand:+ start:321 stop:1262 length:942 start_codon:yes stop_codon:yes gene_type:complete